MKEEEKSKKILEAYSIFQTRKGKLVLTDLTKKCGLFTSTDNLDPQLLAYREGQRDILHQLLILSNTDMSELHKMFVDDYRDSVSRGGN